MASAAPAAAAAAAAMQRRQEEEEDASVYTDQDLRDHWEFKILRANTMAFRSPEVLRRACEEEARAGWVLVEKFDDQRLRFKRPASARENDRNLPFDPYRTHYGMDSSKFAVLLIAIIFGSFLVALGIVALCVHFFD